MRMICFDEATTRIFDQCSAFLLCFCVSSSCGKQCPTVSGLTCEESSNIKVFQILDSVSIVAGGCAVSCHTNVGLVSNQASDGYRMNA